MATRVPLYVDFEEGKIFPMEVGDTIDATVAILGNNLGKKRILYIRMNFLGGFYGGK